MATGLPNGQGKGGGARAWAERWDKGEGAIGWGGVGPWERGGKGLGHGGDSDITQKYS